MLSFSTVGLVFSLSLLASHLPEGHSQGYILHDTLPGPLVPSAGPPPEELALCSSYLHIPLCPLAGYKLPEDRRAVSWVHLAEHPALSLPYRILNKYRTENDCSRVRDPGFYKDYSPIKVLHENKSDYLCINEKLEGGDQIRSKSVAKYLSEVYSNNDDFTLNILQR